MGNSFESGCPACARRDAWIYSFIVPQPLFFVTSRGIRSAKCLPYEQGNMFDGVGSIDKAALDPSTVPGMT